MTRKIDIRKRALLLDGYFKVEEAYVSYEKFDGTMSQPVRRLDFVRGDAVAGILFNKQRQRVILVSQFRYATLSRGTGWTTEAVAGSVDPGETPEEAVKREILEEAGYEVETLERISCFYPTPGVTSERIILYYAETRGDGPVAKGGGLAARERRHPGSRLAARRGVRTARPWRYRGRQDDYRADVAAGANHTGADRIDRQRHHPAAAKQA